MKITPRDIDLNKLYEWSIHRCQLGQWDNAKKRKRFISMCELWLDVASRFESEIPYSVQLGIWHGHSAHMIQELARMVYGSRTLLDSNFLFGIDSFKGLQPTTEDGPLTQEVQQHFFVQDIDLPNDALDCWCIIDDSIPNAFRWLPHGYSLPNQVYGFVAIDLDLYSPTKESLEFFWPRMRPGGIVYVDDYGYADYPGCRRAVDEFRGKYGLDGTHEEESGIWWCQVPAGGTGIVLMPDAGGRVDGLAQATKDC